MKLSTGALNIHAVHTSSRVGVYNQGEDCPRVLDTDVVVSKSRLFGTAGQDAK